MIALRRTLHQHPELSGQEHQTADTICSFLHGAGLSPRRVSETGVVCDLQGQTSGPMVAIRADTDALPILENTGLPFASQKPGCMHACGHDGHSSILLGAALTLAAEPPAGPIRCIWQPAEESALGACQMIEAGVLDNVGMIFGGHIDPRYPSGHLIVTDGPVSASADHLLIDVRGCQGHGARPHETRDAIHAASQLVIALQSIVSREVDPARAAVVSVCRFHAGSRHNIIPGHAHIEGTIRADDDAVRQHIHSSIHRISDAIAAMLGVQITVEIKSGPPAIHNSSRPTELARQAARHVTRNVSVMPGKNMGAEDFSHYLRHVPGCYIRFGAAHPDKPAAPAHSSQFDFHELAMATAADWMVAVAHAASSALTQEQALSAAR
jgi:hippurate hydrolase